jgi:hypothetical protein
MFGHDEETGIENENWSSLSAAMLTLFTYVTVRNAARVGPCVVTSKSA